MLGDTDAPLDSSTTLEEIMKLGVTQHADQYLKHNNNIMVCKLS